MPANTRLLLLGVLLVGCRFDARGSGAPEPAEAGAETSIEDASAPSCANGLKDGSESDVDCGGPSCPKCNVGYSCVSAADCKTDICAANARCAVPSCSDGLKNGKETDIDCGGPDCPNKCDTGRGCATGADCASAVCDGSAKCASASCADKASNGTETDVDCGGGACPACATGQLCKFTTDCGIPFVCASGVCRPAVSCKALLGARPGLPSATYSLDPDGIGANPAFDAYCDMVTDGGGWTFFAHVNQDYAAAKLFEGDVGVYRADRVDDGTTYGRGGSLAYLEHTSMMLVIDGLDPVAAAADKRLLIFSYAAGAEGFNKGPVPCSGLGLGFSYRTTLTGPFTAAGTTNGCDAARWYARTAGDTAYLSAFNSASFGNHWGAGMGGTDTANHDGWWYVR